MNTSELELELEAEPASAYPNAKQQPGGFARDIDAPVVALPHIPPAAEQRYRLAAVRLEAALEARGARARGALGQLVIVTSPSRGDGKTTTALHLATALSRGLGRRVALVELDPTRPGLAEQLKLSDRRGIADVVAGRAGLDEVLLRGEENGPLMVHGGDGASRVLSPAALLKPLNALREYHDLVIADCAAVAASADAAVLGRHADGLLLVVRAGATTGPSLAGTLEALVDTPLLGTIINDLNGDVRAYASRQRGFRPVPLEVEDD
jgi:Mrp family chromosome partitioning ATPase